MGMYYVYAEGGSAPKVEHRSIEEASQEARRIARKTIGKRVMVVQVVEMLIGEVMINQIPLRNFEPADAGISAE